MSTLVMSSWRPEHWSTAMDPQSLQYKKVTLGISKSLTPEQLTDFKFMCKDIPGFSQFDMEEISDGASLITRLEQLSVLSRDNVELVATLLGTVSRGDLEAELRQYMSRFAGGGQGMEQGQVKGYYAQPMSAELQQRASGPLQSGVYNSQHPSLQATMGPALTEEFDIIVENIGRDWRQLARRLGLTEMDIECITEEHSRNLREQSRQALWTWKKNQRQAATREVLIHTLRKCRMNYIADIVEGYIQQ